MKQSPGRGRLWVFSLLSWRVAGAMSLTNHSSLRNVESQLVLACVGELAQLDTMDFAADERGDLVYLSDALWKQVRKRRIGVFAMFIVLEGLQRGVSSWTIRNTASK